MNIKFEHWVSCTIITLQCCRLSWSRNINYILWAKKQKLVNALVETPFKLHGKHLERWRNVRERVSKVDEFILPTNIDKAKSLLLDEISNQSDTLSLVPPMIMAIGYATAATAVDGFVKIFVWKLAAPVTAPPLKYVSDWCCNLAFCDDPTSIVAIQHHLRIENVN